jgi:hypothetical protein
MPLSTIFQLNMWRSVLFVEEIGTVSAHGTLIYFISLISDKISHT